MTAAWVRSEAPSLASMHCTWFLTVLVLISNSLAICWLDRPPDTSRKTSTSRGVSASRGDGSPFSSCFPPFLRGSAGRGKEVRGSPLRRRPLDETPKQPEKWQRDSSHR